MNKVIFIIVASLCTNLILIGCTNNENKNLSSNKEINIEELAKWNGQWDMGDENKTGPNGKILIENADKEKFKFSIEASYISTIIRDNGEIYQNPHLGSVEGIAYLKSEKEAYYTTDCLPDYVMIFEMNDNTITIKELNKDTNEDYGASPFAGFNVRYRAEYLKNKL
jgi:hypothetical protein